MKRHGSLMPQVTEWSNICLAFHNAAKGKRDRKEVKDFQYCLEENLKHVQQRLSSGTMTYGSYRFFTVQDPKVRTICAAPFEQRVTHHALINIVGPLLDASQIHHSYACRTGKGQHLALAQASRWASRNEFYLKMDIRKYFDSIGHKKVMHLLAKRFKDSQVLQVFSDIVASYEASPGRGLPLGNLTSQYLANFYLETFDHWIKEYLRQKCYLRYMDDMLLFGDKKQLLGIREYAGDFLKTHLGLELKHGGMINRTAKGIGFLGSVVYPDRIRLSRQAKKRVRARFRTYEHMYQAGHLETDELQARVQALWAGLFQVQSRGWRNTLSRKCLDI